jgi:uncharacterized membrane protein YczE
MTKSYFGKKRVFIYALGLFLYALGIAVAAKTELGIAPVSTFPYALSFITPFSFGITTFFLTVTYILIQMILYGKDFEKRQYFQIVVGVMFSSFIDLSMYLVRGVNPEIYINRLLVLGIGCVILALGITLSVISNVVIPPAEGAIKAIADKTNMDFGNVKIIFDSTIVVLAIAVSLIFLGELVGFKEGTIISVFLTGFLTKFFMKIFGGKIESFIN